MGMAEAVEAFCVKCREKRDVKDPTLVTMKNGRHAIQGICPECGTKLFRMVSNEAAEAFKATKA
jgi:predicted  nucleic acid-binding Zn-ribbon protein